jgi:hypothetical protein
VPASPSGMKRPTVKSHQPVAAMCPIHRRHLRPPLRLPTPTTNVAPCQSPLTRRHHSSAVRPAHNRGQARPRIGAVPQCDLSQDRLSKLLTQLISFACWSNKGDPGPYIVVPSSPSSAWRSRVKLALSPVRVDSPSGFPMREQ